MALSPIMQFLSILFLFTASAAVTTAEKDCGIPVYWGLNSDEGSLSEACDSGLYNMVYITSLLVYNSPTPDAILLFNKHCDPWTPGDCAILSADIRHCQSKGVKVLLAIEISIERPEINYPTEPLVDYLWQSFLGGRNELVDRPFGDAALDGIDLSVYLGPEIFYYDFARALKQKNVYVSASPGCKLSGNPLALAAKAGVFDSMSVGFINTDCDYSEVGLEGVISTWNEWVTSTSPASKLYFTVPASADAFNFPAGFIPVDTMVKEVLPRIRYSERYAGVGLYNRYFDRRSNYSSDIGPAVCDYTGKKEEEKKMVSARNWIKKFSISRLV